MDWLLDLLGLNKGKATMNAADQNRDLIGGLNNQMTGLIDAGTGRQAGYLNDALGLANMGANAPGILGDAYGLNGPAGTTRAQAAFQAGPGYQFAMDQGIQALERRAAARGNFQSGNTDLDTLNYAQGLANQEYNNWLTGVQGGIGQQMGALNNLSGLYGQDTAYRTALAGDIASAYMGANNQHAAGREAGQGALWGLLNNVAGVAGSVMGMNNGLGYGGGK